jgi:ERCC4-type nuclease
VRNIILIDEREGSREMADLIPESILVTLLFGDCTFSGNGPHGPVQIGVERKRVRDLLNSIATGRLSGHQIPGLLKEYGRVYLVIEGRWTRKKKIEQGGRTFSTEGVWHYLMSMQEAGIRVTLTEDLQETCEWIQWLESWWSKPWKGHKALKVVGRVTPPVASLVPEDVSVMMRMVTGLTGVRWTKAKALSETFETMEDLVCAEEGEIARTPGIGMIMARRIWKELHEKGG